MFLDAKDVKLIKHYKDRKEEQKIYTTSSSEQIVYIDMEEETLLKTMIVINFGKDGKAPKKLSISANVYSMIDMEFEISAYKIRSQSPYFTKIMAPLRTLVELDPSTNKLVITCKKEKCKGKAKVRLIANYIGY